MTTKNKSATSVEIKNITTAIIEIKDLIKEHRAEHRSDMDTLYNRFDNKTIAIEKIIAKNKETALETFAGKWVEKVSIGLITTVAATLLVFLLTGSVS